MNHCLQRFKEPKETKLNLNTKLLHNNKNKM